MYGTIVQNSGSKTYMETLFAHANRIQTPTAGGCPSRSRPPRPLAIHRFGDMPAMDRFHWGYAPSWWKRRPVANASLKTLLRGSAVWRPLLAQRVLVPVDGWYQPVADSDDKIYQYIHASDGQPVYIAGLTAWRPGNTHGKQDGLAIIIDEMSGSKKRRQTRPVVLPIEAARAWVDPDTPIINALELACTPWVPHTVENPNS